MLGHRDTQRLLQLAQDNDCKLLLSQPILQTHLGKVWHGWTLSALRERRIGAQWCWGAVVGCLLLVFELALVLPLVAVCPPLGRELRAMESDEGVSTVYLLEVPLLKFALHFAADATLAIGLAALAAGAAPVPVPLLLLFAIGSLWEEAGRLARAGGGGDASESRRKRMRRVLASFTSDGMNLIDLAASALTCAALTAQLIVEAGNDGSLAIPAAAGNIAAAPPLATLDGSSSDSQAPTVRVLQTLATLLLWLKPLHVLRLSSTAGPLVLMVGRMLRRDVFNWLLVLGCILLSFSAALFVLHGGGEYVACVQPDAFHLASGGAWSAQALWYFRGVWEDALVSEAQFECAHAAPLPALAVPLAYMLQVLVALLLVNMLIAMMGKVRARILIPHPLLACMPPPF